MANPKTPNIGLNKIDRSSPATTYFDLEKYIDQNADTIDQFAGKVNAAIEDTSQRLDTEKHQEVVLQPGMQILNAQRNAPFSLSGIKGRTLVNLLGRDGDLEKLSSILYYSNTSAEIDNTAMCSGSGSIKVTATGTGTTEHYIDLTGDYRVKRGSYYVAVGMVKPIKGAAQIRVYNQSHPAPDPNFFMAVSNVITETGVFSLVRTKFHPLEDSGVIARLYLLKDPKTELYIQNGESSNFDSLRIYEITAEEYAAIDSMTPEQTVAQYPYVDSVQPACNPYAIRYGENLAPSIYEWNLVDTVVNQPYSATMTPSSTNRVTYVEIPTVPDQVYTFSATHNGNIALSFFDENGTVVNSSGYTSDSTVTATAGSSAKKMRLSFSNLSVSIGTFTFYNPMVTIGSVPKPFKPRENSMFALQTDLYADPLTGANADEVFEKDGQYFKLAKWKKVVSDGNQAWEFHSNGVGGYKKVKHKIPADFPLSGGQYAVKYDGKLLKQDGATSTADSFNIFPFSGASADINGYVFYQISNTDSGWGNDYTPTADEIMAYFNGWRMRLWNSIDPFNGVGEKAWATVVSGGGSYWTSTLPTTQALDWTPYQLVYQLATPTVEPIVSEGMLTFNEGDNQVEVGTGIVLRERANPRTSGDTGIHVINDLYLPGSALVNKAEKIFAVYKNGYLDQWDYRSNNAYGKERRAKGEGYDPAAAYTVTYLMLDKSPIVPFTGSCATNEKAILQSLTEAVQQNASAVSALMNKKAEEDIPGWITPTLLNGWVYFGGGTTPGYLKDTNGFVHLKGRLKAGGINSVMFVLPRGYRPYQPYFVTARAYTTSNTTCTCVIDIDGTVYVTDYNSEINIDGLSFLAEQ